ncbi:MAG: DUF5701 family protein [bacterium]
MKLSYQDELRKEFDRQVENLIQKRYPKAADVRAKDFLKHIEPLKGRIRTLSKRERDAREGRVPFVIVVKNDLVAGEKAMSLVEREKKNGFTVMDADEIKGFEPIEGVRIPTDAAYLVVDIDTGKETLNITPDKALKIIERENRSPLTLDEGVALITHHPEILMRNGGFSLPGSRCGDRRVTALWISGGRPKLGWCWAGNPHTWLGSASCGRRVGV